MEKCKRLLKPIIFITVLFVIIIGIILSTYLYALPKIINSNYTINFIEKQFNKITNAKLVLTEPELKTKITPNIDFKLKKLEIISNNKSICKIESFKTNISFAKILLYKINIKNLTLEKGYVKVNDLLNILPKSEKQTKSLWTVNVFDSNVAVKKFDLIYKDINNVIYLLNASDIKMEQKKKEKTNIKYNICLKIKNNINTITVTAKDDNKIYLNKDKIFIDGTNFNINKTTIKLKGYLKDEKHYNLNISSEKLLFETISDIINSNLIIPNGKTLLNNFGNIKGVFNFNINAKNNKFSGNINLKNLTLNLKACNNIPICINAGKILIKEKDILLKDFNGFYRNNKLNTITFNGTINNYMKNLTAHIVGDALVTNDFMKQDLTPMINYPISLVGNAKTRLIIDFKNNKINLKWLFRISPQEDLLIGGEPLSKYKLERVLVSNFEIEKTMFNIKSIDYFITLPPKGNHKSKIIKALSLNGKIDFSKGIDFRTMGFKITEPMPSEFLNMIIRQDIFKKGTVTGELIAVDGKKGVKLFGNINLSKIRIPSQRIYIKQGSLTTNFDKIKIVANGRFRKSDYSIDGIFRNNIAFPIYIEDLQLKLDKIDIDSLLATFNKQGETKIEKNENISDEDNTPTFDVRNLIIKNCDFELNQGKYKEIDFGNLHAKMTLDEDSHLDLDSNKFDFCKGNSSVHACMDILNHKYHIRLGARNIDSNIFATTMFGLKDEITGKGSGLIDLNTDKSLKLNGKIKFTIKDGVIGKVGFLQYVLNVASIFRNPIAMISPTTIFDLVNIPKGKFDKIHGDLTIKNNNIENIQIKSSAEQLASYITGSFNLDTRDTSLRVYTKFSNKGKGIYGILRSISLNNIAKHIPIKEQKQYNYYSSEIKEIPDIQSKNYQIFLTKIEGDVEHENFLSSLQRIK